MNKLANFITKYAWPILIVTIVLTILAGMQIKHLKVEDDITKYMSADDPEIEFYSEIVDKFGIELQESIHIVQRYFVSNGLNVKSKTYYSHNLYDYPIKE